MWRIAREFKTHICFQRPSMPFTRGALKALRHGRSTAWATSPHQKHFGGEFLKSVAQKVVEQFYY